MSLVRYGRFADAAPPERELLEVADDGSATAWRSIARAGGRFAGQVPDPARLHVLVEAAMAVDPPRSVELPPDVVVETLEVGGVEVTLPLDAPPAGPWADLAMACRAALVEVSASPVAAVGASIGADATLRLEHRGVEPLEVELGSMTARATLWRDGAAVWTGSFAIPHDLERGAVGPGWTLELAPATPLPAATGILLAQVDLVADDAGVLVPLTLTARADL